MISAPDRKFHKEKTLCRGLKSLYITNRLILAQHLQHIIFRNRINFLQKCKETTQQPIYDGLQDHLNVGNIEEEPLPDWSAYSFMSSEYNADPLLLIPDYKYTFSGPVIRLPASYDREVRFISHAIPTIIQSIHFNYNGYLATEIPVTIC